MNLKKLFLIGSLFITGMVNAQTDFQPGYILKTPGDTIFGQIDAVLNPKELKKLGQVTILVLVMILLWVGRN